MQTTKKWWAAMVFLALSTLTWGEHAFGLERDAVELRQINCIATAIWHEARSESEIGQAAIAWVIMNRVQNGFADSPCAVVFQTHTIYNKEINKRIRVCQFVWHCDSRTRAPNRNSDLWEKIEKIAYDVYVMGTYYGVLPANTVFFHSRFINPRWGYHRVATIGNHIFYSRRPPRKVNT